MFKHFNISAAKAVTFSLAALFIFGLVLSTAPPSVYHNDNGETISVSCTLGIQHPPGFPFYHGC